jgi:hypothetical protein
MNFQMVELENGRVQVRTPNGRVAHIQEWDNSWIIEQELPERRFPTLGDAFDFVSQIECTVGTVHLPKAGMNDPESIQVRYADVEYFGAVYKDARCMNERWHLERRSGQVCPFKFQRRVKLLNHPSTERRYSLDPTRAF